MEVSNRRSASRSVVAGSVWESRMKMDEVKGGIKVFINGEDKNSEEVIDRKDGGDNILNQQNHIVGGVVREKRKTWKCEPVDVIARNSILIRKIRSEEDDSCEEEEEEFHDSAEAIEKKSPIQARNRRSDDESSSKEVSRSVEVIEKKKKNPNQKRKSSSRSRSLKVSDETISKELGDIRSRIDLVNGDKNGEEEEIEVSKKNFDVMEVKFSEEQRSKKNLILKEKSNQLTPAPISVGRKNQEPLAVNHSSDLRKPFPEELEIFPETHNMLQDIVDLIMWVDTEKSALVFGIGTLVILLSSFTKDINFSLMSIVSYMGLLYLAAIFLYRTILCREPIDLNDSIHTVGEDEAIWVVKLVLPYLNKFLLKLRLLFSGDPATTMKVAALLFVLARYGSFITLWRITKLGFFGVFTLPKAYTWYSTQLSRDGNNIFHTLVDNADRFLVRSS